MARIIVRRRSAGILAAKSVFALPAFLIVNAFLLMVVVVVTFWSLVIFGVAGTVRMVRRYARR